MMINVLSTVALLSLSLDISGPLHSYRAAARANPFPLLVIAPAKLDHLRSTLLTNHSPACRVLSAVLDNPNEPSQRNAYTPPSCNQDMSMASARIFPSRR